MAPMLSAGLGAGGVGTLIAGEGEEDGDESALCVSTVGTGLEVGAGDTEAPGELGVGLGGNKSIQVHASAEATYFSQLDASKLRMQPGRPLAMLL
jgi:hypothetical protein